LAANGLLHGTTCASRRGKKKRINEQTNEICILNS
jgi:hypothetical protein